MGNVLVIGGSYFAGRVFVEELTKHGDVNVYVFNRGRQPLGMPTVTELRGDRDRIEQVATAIPPLDWDTVVDFCGYEPAQVMSLLDHLPGNVRQYIFISTTTVYDRTTRLPVREDAPKLAAPQKELGSQSRYGFDKWLSEIAVQTECERRGIAFTIFRPAVIYGYYNYAPRESYFFDRLTSHRPIEIPEHNLSLFSVIWVVDMAQALIRALGEPRAFGKVYNLASDELISYGRIIDVLGEITALWAVCGILNVLVFIPLLLSTLPTPESTAARHGKLQHLLTALGHGVSHRINAITITVIGVFLVMGSIAMSGKITIGESEPGSPLLYRNHDYNVSSTAVNNLFPGSEQLLLVAKADKPGGLKDPEAMKAIEAFNNHMMLDPELGGVKSVPTLVRQVNKLIHNGDQRWEQLPKDAQLVGGVLFAYMASSPIPGILNDFITPDYSKANLALFYKDHKGETVDRAIAMAREGATMVAGMAKGVTIELAGGVLGVTAAVNHDVFIDNLIVIPMVFLLICGLVGFTYRSWQAGLLMFGAMLIPTALTYAYLSVNGIGLNINTVPLISVGLGIGIDYAVYMIDRIRDELHEHADVKAAIGRSVASTGRAVTCTVTTLVGGIVAWVFVSDLRFQADAAKLLIFMIAVCAVTAMVFVPAWIAAFRPRFIVREADPEIQALEI